MHIGREAIRGFYKVLRARQPRPSCSRCGPLGHEAAFFWALTVDLGESRMRIEIISIMTFNDDGKIASMKAYWAPENVSRRETR